MRSRALAVSSLGVLLLFPGCGGGGSNPAPPPPPPPPPPALLLATSSLPNAVVAQIYLASLVASGGTPPYSWTATGTPQGLTVDALGNIMGRAVASGSASLNVQVKDSGSPAQTAKGTVSLTIEASLPLAAQTSVLPKAAVGRVYNAGLAAIGGTPPYAWTLGSGTLPAGLTLDSRGLISGTPLVTAVGTVSLSFVVTDSGSPAQTSSASLNLIVTQPLGRNDSIATAALITNGTSNASISPHSDPSSTGPDSDYYKLTANPAATVNVEIFAARLFPPSPLDSVIEILDGTGKRFTTCKDPIQAFLVPPAVIDPNPNDFNDTCINDDDPNTNTTDSSLGFQVPGTSGGPPVTFYVHVFDWRGDARPDMLYQIQISGAN